MPRKTNTELVTPFWRYLRFHAVLEARAIRHRAAWGLGPCRPMSVVELASGYNPREHLNPRTSRRVAGEASWI